MVETIQSTLDQIDDQGGMYDEFVLDIFTGLLTFENPEFHLYLNQLKNTYNESDDQGIEAD